MFFVSGITSEMLKSVIQVFHKDSSSLLFTSLKTKNMTIVNSFALIRIISKSQDN